MRKLLRLALPRPIPAAQVLAALALATLALAACARKQTTTGDPAVDHFLGADYGKMTQVLGHTERFAWRNPAFNPKDYSAVLLDPTVVWRKDVLAELSKVNPAELDALTRHFDEVLKKTMTDIDFPLKDTPAPRTMRVSAAITQVKASNPALNTVFSVLPVGILVTLGQKAVGVADPNVGSCTVEVRFSDAMTGETLGLFSDHKDGDKYDSANFHELGQAQKAIDQWAEMLREGILRNWGVRKL
jgi:hypothetical protein